MGEYSDKTEGKVKEFYGRVSGDRSKQAEGHALQARGGLKGLIDRARNALERAFRNDGAGRARRHT